MLGEFERALLAVLLIVLMTGMGATLTPAAFQMPSVLPEVSRPIRSPRGQVPEATSAVERKAPRSSIITAQMAYSATARELAPVAG